MGEKQEKIREILKRRKRLYQRAQEIKKVEKKTTGGKIMAIQDFLASLLEKGRGAGQGIANEYLGILSHLKRIPGAAAEGYQAGGLKGAAHYLGAGALRRSKEYWKGLAGLAGAGAATGLGAARLAGKLGRRKKGIAAMLKALKRSKKYKRLLKSLRKNRAALTYGALGAGALGAGAYGYNRSKKRRG